MTNHSSPIIIWEKWINPFGLNPEDVEWPGYSDGSQSDDDDSPIENDSYSAEKETRPSKASHSYKKIHAISTSMGIIPYNEHTDCSKIFNFWVGHSNFNITPKIANIIQNIDGVETLDVFTRYRFRASFGKAFNDRDIMSAINIITYEAIE